MSTDSEGEDAAETTDDEKNRFIREVEARSERSGRRQAKVQRAKSHNQRLGDAVEDWELLSDDPDAEPKEVPSPYYQAGRR